METKDVKRNVRAIKPEKEWDEEVQERYRRLDSAIYSFYEPLAKERQWIEMLANEHKWNERKLYAARQRIRELEGEIHDLKHHGQQDTPESTNTTDTDNTGSPVS